MYSDDYESQYINTFAMAYSTSNLCVWASAFSCISWKFSSILDIANYSHIFGSFRLDLLLSLVIL
jgi:hypothetical protein